MPVIFKVSTGASAGRWVLLEACQRLEVGRTELADFVVADDPYISSVHFVLETDRSACYVQDLNSSNGTYLNGRRLLERTLLRNEDQIQAGKTRFLVSTEETASNGNVTGRAVPSL